MSQQSDEFLEDYFSGNLDRPCTECKGQRVVARCAEYGCRYAVADGCKNCYDHLTEGENEVVQDRLEEEAEMRWFAMQSGDFS
jgi:hypothetical protein